MKIRNGFVSNSSSASFVLIADADCPVDLECDEFVKQWLESEVDDAR